MRLERFYQLCVALPLAVPAVTWPLARFMENDATVVSRLAEVAAVLATAALIGGVPYVLLALPLLWLFRRKPVRAYQRFSLVAPIVFAAFLFLFFLTLSAFSPGDHKLSVGLISGGYYALWGVGVGYFYVGVVHLLRITLSRLGVLHAEGAV